MGKKWRDFEVNGYRLGYLRGQVVATWRGSIKRHRQRLGPAATEAEARALLRAFVAGRVEAPARVTVKYLFELYTRDREADGKNVETFHHNWQALEPFFGPLPPNAITDDLCRQYAQQRLADGKSVGTVWTELGRLRSAMLWASKRQHISIAPYVWMPSKPAGRKGNREAGEVAVLEGARSRGPACRCLGEGLAEKCPLISRNRRSARPLGRLMWFRSGGHDEHRRTHQKGAR